MVASGCNPKCNHCNPNATLTQPSTAENATLSLQNGNCINDSVKVDDGITGTTIKRPGFQKMLTAIEAGYISAVFVKDLSRLGRNYIEVGKLTEEFFPLHDIRLVAVSDGVDSDEGEDDFTPFKNIMNEYYAKDISKKRRIVNKMKGNAGVPLSPPLYGYIKNPDDPRFWVVEPEAAEVVRRIYRMALEGYGLAETAALDCQAKIVQKLFSQV